jgi:hypothetical protein
LAAKKPEWADSRLAKDNQLLQAKRRSNGMVDA